MTNNANLKRAARSFMEKHEGVPYLTALKAVDEPLHELRDLVSMPRVRDFNFTTLFRLVTAQGNYAKVYADVDRYGFRIIEKLDLSRYRHYTNFFEAVTERRKLLEAHDAYDLWEYRSLQRAGLLGSDAPDLEPFFHHYDWNLGSSFGTMRSTYRYGIFAVKIGPLIFPDDDDSYIPVTPNQLEALQSGSPVGHIESFSRVEEDPRKAEIWTDKYSVLATSKYERIFGMATMNILFRRTLPEFHEALKSRGLDPDDFDFSDVSESEISFNQFAANLSAEQSGSRLFSGMNTQNALLWD